MSTCNWCANDITPRSGGVTIRSDFGSLHDADICRSCAVKHFAPADGVAVLESRLAALESRVASGRVTVNDAIVELRQGLVAVTCLGTLGSVGDLAAKLDALESLAKMLKARSDLANTWMSDHLVEHANFTKILKARSDCDNTWKSDHLAKHRVNGDLVAEHGFDAGESPTADFGEFTPAPTPPVNVAPASVPIGLAAEVAELLTRRVVVTRLDKIWRIDIGSETYHVGEDTTPDITTRVAAARIVARILDDRLAVVRAVAWPACTGCDLRGSAWPECVGCGTDGE